MISSLTGESTMSAYQPSKYVAVRAGGVSIGSVSPRAVRHARRMAPHRAAVAVLGEALVDVVVAADGTARAVPGGGPFNSARALARLGSEVVFVGRLSCDRFGARLRSLLLADGVRLGGLACSPLPTTLAVAEVGDDGAATYGFYVAATSAADLAAPDARAALPADVAVVHVGTLGLVLEPLATSVDVVLQELPAHVLVFCDPNCRAGAIPDRGGYLARLHRVLRRTDVVKVSGDDLAYLAPGAHPLTAARSLLDAGPAVVLFTDGAAAVRVLTRAGELELPVPQVTVVDTVGAGDAFGAAFLHRWAGQGRGRAELADLAALADAADFGSRVAAITCARVGADPPTAADLESDGAP